MIYLRKEMKNILSTYHTNVHYQKSNQSVDFPYIVYDFPNSFVKEQQEIFNLDVDIYDIDDDTTALEVLAQSIWKGLDHHRHNDNHMQFSIYRANRLPPLDEKDESLKRRKLIFELRYFDKNQ